MKNKVIAALLSLLAAFGLWLYVITVVSPGSEASFSVQVEVDNESVLNDKGWMLKPNQNPVVHLNLSGNRSDLIKLTNKNIIVKVDAAKITGNEPGQTAQLNYTIAYPGNVPNNAITVVSRNPDYIELEYWAYEEKPVPVQETYVGIPEEGYAISSAVFSAPQLTVCGPKDVVDRIAVARVEIDRTGLKESISKEMTFRYYDSQGNVVDGAFITTAELGDKQQVKVDLVVQRSKEIPVTVELLPGGGATKDNCIVTYSLQTIVVAGSEENLANLTELKLATIDLSKVEDEENFKLKVEPPTGINNVTGVAEVIVTVKVTGLETVTLPVTNIQTMNTGNLQAVIDAKELQVDFRGPKSLINRLTADDVTAYADCTGKSSGNYSDIPVQFVFNNIEGVGAVGTYTIHVVLKDILRSQ